MKLTSIEESIASIAEGTLPPEYVDIALNDFNMTKPELIAALKNMGFKDFLELTQAFGFKDYDQAYGMLKKAAGIDDDRVSMVPKEGEEYDEVDEAID